MDDQGLGPAGTSDVDIRVPAGPTHLASIRLVTSALAAQACFDLETVADLTLAVNEACSILITRAREGAWLRCHFAVAFLALHFRAEVTATRPRLPKLGSLDWRVIGSLTDSVATWVDADDLLHIELRRRGAVAT